MVFDYTLNNDELKICRDLAKTKYENGQKEKLNDKLNMTPAEGDYSNWRSSYYLQGTCGEFAFAKIHGISYPTPLNLELIKKNAKDNGDIQTKGSIKIEVKTRDRLDRDLLIPTFKKNDWHIPFYVLVVTVKKYLTYRYVGYATRNIVFRNVNVEDIGGYGCPCHVIKQKELVPEKLTNTLGFNYEVV